MSDAIRYEMCLEHAVEKKKHFSTIFKIKENVKAAEFFPINYGFYFSICHNNLIVCPMYRYPKDDDGRLGCTNA